MSLGAAPDALFQFISYLTGGERRKKAQALARGEDPDGDAATLDVLGALQKFAGIRPDPEALIEVLEPLQPRLYSISSSPKTNPGRVSLTVDTVRYERLTAASGSASPRPGSAAASSDAGELLVYVQKAHGFALPSRRRRRRSSWSDPAPASRRSAPSCTSGMATKAAGAGMAVLRPPARGLRLLLCRRVGDAAAARHADQSVARLVARRGAKDLCAGQDARGRARELWAWLQRGAHFYVCGDAKRMAKDVETTLRDIVVRCGNASPEAAVAFVSDLKASGRYQADVY